MKIREQLLLLLGAALVVTTVASTWLQVRWTHEALETQAKKAAEETANDTAQDLVAHITADADPDDISERLGYESRRHHNVASMEFTFDSDDDTTVSVNLGAVDEEARVNREQRPKKKKPALRRDDVRRAVADHGESSRPPGSRTVEPLWRTPERNDSAGWAKLAAASSQAQKRPAPRGPIKVDLRDDPQRQGRYYEVTVPVELPGSRHGQLTARITLEPVDRLARIEVRVSAAVTGTALLILMIVSAFIANRLVARPVEELARAMRGVEGGDLSRRVLARRSDEIGKLADGFNAMVERLGAADEEIRAFNRRLAEEVRAATTDLARKNEALAHLNKLLVETRSELGDKERLAALGQLAAQLAHEIGTPLASVSGHLQLAMSARETSPALRERLGKAARELERVSKIVRDYLDSTRPIKPARVDCDLERLIDDALGIALGTLPEVDRPGFAIERRVDARAAHVATDPGLLRQILINLLTNAIDAVAGKEPAREGRVAIELDARGGAIELRVRDNGVGIPPDDAARIFEPFYTTKGRGKGTGLGLAICRELASALGGRLGVESTPGEGSTFTLRLPTTGQSVQPSTWAGSGRVN